MATFRDMKDRIALETRYVTTAASSGFEPQIEDAIRSAIDLYNEEKFWFNQAQWTFNPDALTRYLPYPQDCIGIDSFMLQDSGQSRYQLLPRVFTYIDYLDTHQQYKGRPVYYAIVGSHPNRQIRLHPQTDQGGYLLEITGLKDISPPASDTEADNPWMNEAERLIRLSAERELYSYVFKRPEMVPMLDKGVAEAKDHMAVKTVKGVANRMTMMPWNF